MKQTISTVYGSVFKVNFVYLGSVSSNAVA